MRTQQITKPDKLPVALQQVKSWLRMEENYADAEILALMGSAVKRAEAICNRPFINRQYESKLDCLPPCISLNINTVQSVDSIKYIDPDGAEQTLAPSEYQVDLGNEFQKARIVPAYGKSWPSIRSQLNSITVTFTAGYGDNINAVPDNVQLGIMYLVNHYFDCREVTTNNDKTTPETVTALLESERVPVI